MNEITTLEELTTARRPRNAQAVHFALNLPELPGPGLYLEIRKRAGGDLRRYCTPRKGRSLKQPVYLGKQSETTLIGAYRAMLTAAANRDLPTHQRPEVLNLTIDGAFRQWMRAREPQHYANPNAFDMKRSNALYLRIWENYFAPYADRDYLRDMRAGTVTAIINQAHAAGCPPSALRRGLWFFKSLVAYSKNHLSLSEVEAPATLGEALLGVQLPKARKRQITASEEEFRALFDALPEDAEGGAVAWLMLTGVRKMEGLLMDWSEIKGRVWTIPAERMKQGEPHKIPLTRAHYAVLRHSPTWRSKTGLVWPAPGGLPMPPKKPNNLLRRLKATGKNLLDEVVPLAPHDLRRSFATLLVGKVGIDKKVVDLMIAHKINDADKDEAIRETYQVQAHMYTADVREGWEKFADWWLQDNAPDVRRIGDGRGSEYSGLDDAA